MNSEKMMTTDDDNDDGESVIFNVNAYWVYLVNSISLIQLRNGYQVSNLLRQYALYNFNHDSCSGSLIISFISPAQLSPRPPCFQNLMLCSIQCHQITSLYPRFICSQISSIRKKFCEQMICQPSHAQLWPMDQYTT